MPHRPAKKMGVSYSMMDKAILNTLALTGQELDESKDQRQHTRPMQRLWPRLLLGMPPQGEEPLLHFRRDVQRVMFAFVFLDVVVDLAGRMQQYPEAWMQLQREEAPASSNNWARTDKMNNYEAARAGCVGKAWRRGLRCNCRPKTQGDIPTNKNRILVANVQSKK